jgi:hypothetical protein
VPQSAGLVKRAGGVVTVPDSWRTSFVTALLVLAIQSVIGLPQSAFARASDISRTQSQAEHGSVAQEIELGAAYLGGKSVPRDEKKAAYWYEKAANAGDPGAQQQIGYFYQNGIGVDRDPERAAKWFERAVAGGLTSAKVNLGVAYVWGLGVRKDPGFAVKGTEPPHVIWVICTPSESGFQRMRSKRETGLRPAQSFITQWHNSTSP